MVELSEELGEVLDVQEEKEEGIITGLNEISSGEKTAYLAIIAPYVGVKVTPSKIASAQIGLSEEFGIETVIENIKDAQKDCKNLFILLNSPGGLVQSSYKMAKALAKNFENIVVFVPHIAASGGTLCALVGNEIVMGMMSQLTPIDPHNDEVSALSVVRGFEWVKEWFMKTQVEDAPYSYKVLADKYDATQLDTALSSLELMKRYASEILKSSGYEEDEIKNITEQLVTGFYTHEDVINIEMAEKIGLKVCNPNKYPELWEIFRQWLGKYLLKSADKHIIRYHIPPTEKAGEKNGEEKN